MVAPGTPFGPYRVVALLGAGGMGEVYRAHDSRLGRDVALKVLPAHLGADAAAVERLTREARAVAALSHPGILTIYDIGRDGGHVYLVTELLEGETLRRRLKRGPLPWPQALDIASAVASGLAAAHARGIVHRDLKPENVFVTSGGAAKILDFGVAKLVDPQMTGTRTSPAVELTAPGAAVGTLAYMAPEQLEAREVDHRADQFAFGILLHELVGGHHPFRGDTAHEIAAAILRDTPAPLSTARPDTPPAFSRVVARCLARDPANRYASTTDLVLALDDVRADSDSDARTHSIAAVPARRRGGWWLPAGLAAAALLAVGAWVLQPRATAVPAASAASVSAQSVAVLPFGTIGAGERYLADGVTEAVTRELGRVKTVRVIASNSAFAYRDWTDGDIGRELGVALVVRGSVQQTGGRVRINSSLIDARQGTTLWSERYDRDASNVLALQDEIAWQVAAHLATSVGSALLNVPRRHNRRPRRPTTPTSGACRICADVRVSRVPANAGGFHRGIRARRRPGCQLRARSRHARERLHPTVLLRCDRPGRRAEGVPGDREGAGDQPRSSRGLPGARANRLERPQRLPTRSRHRRPQASRRQQPEPGRGLRRVGQGLLPHRDDRRIDRRQ